MNDPALRGRLSRLVRQDIGLQTTMPGVYQVRPTVARQEFFPEVFGRSDGLSFVIEEP